jgi:hypothetical protein
MVPSTMLLTYLVAVRGNHEVVVAGIYGLLGIDQCAVCGERQPVAVDADPFQRMDRRVRVQ